MQQEQSGDVLTVEYLSGAVVEILRPLTQAAGQRSSQRFEYATQTIRLSLFFSNSSGGINGEPQVLFCAATALCLHLYSGADDFLVGVYDTERDRILPVRCTISPEMRRQGDFNAFLHSIRTSFEKAQALLSTPVLPVVSPQVLIHVTREQSSSGVLQLEAAKICFSFQIGRETPQLVVRYRTDQLSKQSLQQITAHVCRILENIPRICEKPHTLLDLCALPEADLHQYLKQSHGEIRQFPRQYETIVAAFDRTTSRTPGAVAVEFDNQRFTYAEVRTLAANMMQRVLQATSSQQAGSQPQQMVVLINASRSVELVAAFLAALCAGAAYVPIDVSMPSDRCRVIAEDSGACCLITDHACWESKYSSWWNLPVIYINAEPSSKATRQKSSKIASPRADVLALWQAQVARVQSCQLGRLYNIIYTSGTTGKPKGVAVFECSMLNNCNDFLERCEIQPGSIVLAAFSISFDPHTLVMLAPLMTGATVLLTPDNIHHESELLCELLSRSTVGFLTPSGWALALTVGWMGNRRMLAITGGEALSLDLIRQLVPLVRVVLNAWGPTEATIVATYEDVTKLSHGPVPIGRANINNRIYIVDDKLNLVPPGFPGEICVAGVAVARGYMNLPERTASYFLPDPFAKFFEANILPTRAPKSACDDAHCRFHLFGDGRLYRTGDVGVWGDDMRVYCQGRIDTQVKIRGYRIEVSEIEQQLLSLPESRAAGVSFAFVRAIDLPSIGMSLVAYLQLEPLQKPAVAASPRSRVVIPQKDPQSSRIESALRVGDTLRPTRGRSNTLSSLALPSPRGRAIQQAILVKAVRTALTEKLPSYMVPAYFEFITSIPLTRNGKVDAAALPIPEIGKRATYLEPVLKHWTPTEQRLREIVGKVLGVSSDEFTSGVDLFQDLGVTSIVTIRLTEAINAEIPDAAITVSILYHHSTIEKLAQYLDSTAEQAAQNGQPVSLASSRSSSVILQRSQRGRQRSSFLWDLYWAGCSLIGLAMIIFMIILPSWPALKFSTWVLRETGSLLYGLMSVPGAYMGYSFVLLCEMLLTKWILIGRYKSGPIPSRSFAFWRWWVVDRFHELGQRIITRYFVGTPWLNLWLKLLGAKVDMYSHIETPEIREYDLLEIGPRSSINFHAALLPRYWESDPESTRPVLHLSRIRLAANSFVGNRAVVPLSKNGEQCSFVPSTTEEDRPPSNRTIPTKFRYNALDVALWMFCSLLGIFMMASIRVAAYYPAFKGSRWVASKIGTEFISRSGDAWNIMLAYSAGLQPFYVNPFLPLLAEQTVVDDIETVVRSNIGVICFVPLTFLLLILGVQASIIVAKWLLVWRITPGQVFRGSFRRFRFWFYCLLMRNAASQLLIFDDTWLIMLFWRLLGASTSITNWLNDMRMFAPDLISIGKHGAVGATAYIVPFYFDGDYVYFSKTTVPNGALVGMHSTLRGESLPAGCTLGVLSSLEPGRVIPPNQALILSDATFPPRSNQHIDGLDWWRLEYTFWRHLRWTVYMITYIVVAPVLVLLVRGAAIAPSGWVMLEMRRRFGRISLALIPLGYFLYVVVVLSCVIVLKWVVHGRLKKKETWIDPDAVLMYYRRMFLVALLEVIVLRSIGGRAWLGTPMWNWICNALGARISGSAIIFASDTFDLDLIQIGAGTVIDRSAVVSPHTREHDVLSFDRVKIGAGCVIGTHAVCMHDVRMFDGSELRSTSLAVPGQRLMEFGTYKGVPSILLKRKRRPTKSPLLSTNSSNSVAKLLVTPLNLPEV